MDRELELEREPEREREPEPELEREPEREPELELERELEREPELELELEPELEPVVVARRSPRRRELGVTVEQYDELLASQHGGCAICGAPPKTRRLDVDHDHRTGKIRGLLCHRCNRALPAWIKPEWLHKAANYLEGT
jgi:hypothetical protein